MKIKIEGATKHASSKKILDGASAVFESGAMNVLMGPNGAGKTSLLKAVALLEKIDGGDIFYDDKPLSKMSRARKLAVRRRMGFAFQNPVFFKASVEENLVYGLRVRGVKPSRDGIDAALSMAGLEGKATLPAGALSGGEKQRLSMARAAILDPDCYIFDEPTANLDPVGAAAAERMMQNIALKGKTVIVTTHNMAQARKISGTIFFMNKGSIDAGADADAFFSRPGNLEAAEYSFAENVFEGFLSSEGGRNIFSVGELQIETGPGNFCDSDSAAVGGSTRKIYLVLRAEDIFVSLAPIDSSARNSFEAVVGKIEPMGSVYSVKAAVGGVNFETVVTKQSVESLKLKTGSKVYLTFKATAAHILRG